MYRHPAPEEPGVTLPKVGIADYKGPDTQPVPLQAKPYQAEQRIFIAT